MKNKINRPYILNINCMLFFMVVILCLSINEGFATLPEEKLQNHKLEQQARNISKKIRCLVCQNQSIDESDAVAAKDLRLLIREKLKNGETEEKIITYIQSRYGDFILLSPPISPYTWALWGMPFIIFILAAGVLFVQYRVSKKYKQERNHTS